MRNNSHRLHSMFCAHQLSIFVFGLLLALPGLVISQTVLVNEPFSVTTGFWSNTPDLVLQNGKGILTVNSAATNAGTLLRSAQTLTWNSNGDKISLSIKVDGIQQAGTTLPVSASARIFFAPDPLPSFVEPYTLSNAFWLDLRSSSAGLVTVSLYQKVEQTNSGYGQILCQISLGTNAFPMQLDLTFHKKAYDFRLSRNGTLLSGALSGALLLSQTFWKDKVHFGVRLVNQEGIRSSLSLDAVKISETYLMSDLFNQYSGFWTSGALLVQSGLGTLTVAGAEPYNSSLMMAQTLFSWPPSNCLHAEFKINGINKAGFDTPVSGSARFFFTPEPLPSFIEPYTLSNTFAMYVDTAPGANAVRVRLFQKTGSQNPGFGEQLAFADFPDSVFPLQVDWTFDRNTFLVQFDKPMMGGGKTLSGFCQLQSSLWNQNLRFGIRTVNLVSNSTALTLGEVQIGLSATNADLSITPDAPLESQAAAVSLFPNQNYAVNGVGEIQKIFGQTANGSLGDAYASQVTPLQLNASRCYIWPPATANVDAWFGTYTPLLGSQAHQINLYEQWDLCQGLIFHSENTNREYWSAYVAAVKKYAPSLSMDFFQPFNEPNYQLWTSKLSSALQARDACYSVLSNLENFETSDFGGTKVLGPCLASSSFFSWEGWENWVRPALQSVANTRERFNYHSYDTPAFGHLAWVEMLQAWSRTSSFATKPKAYITEMNYKISDSQKGEARFKWLCQSLMMMLANPDKFSSANYFLLGDGRQANSSVLFASNASGYYPNSNYYAYWVLAPLRGRMILSSPSPDRSLSIAAACPSASNLVLALWNDGQSTKSVAVDPHLPGGAVVTSVEHRRAFYEDGELVWSQVMEPLTVAPLQITCEPGSLHSVNWRISSPLLLSNQVSEALESFATNAAIGALITTNLAILVNNMRLPNTNTESAGVRLGLYTGDRLAAKKIQVKWNNQAVQDLYLKNIAPIEMGSLGQNLQERNIWCLEFLVPNGSTQLSNTLRFTSLDAEYTLMFVSSVIRPR